MMNAMVLAAAAAVGCDFSLGLGLNLRSMVGIGCEQVTVEVPASDSEATPEEAPEEAPVVLPGINILNKVRARVNLGRLVVDPELQACAEIRLMDNLKRGSWGHNMRAGRFLGRTPKGVGWSEGCGVTTDPNGWSTCKTYSKTATRAGAAVARVGDRYWQLLLVK